MKNIDFGVVADLYDEYVQWDIDIPFFKKICEQYGGSVLELMCGTGRLSIPLLQSGVQLCCVDYSQEMLNVFRRKLKRLELTADVSEQDVRNLDLPEKFDLILLPFHSLSEILQKRDREQALRRIRLHLKPGGAFIVTLQNPAVLAKRLDSVRKIICERSLGDDLELKIWSTSIYNETLNQGEALQEYEIRKNGELLDRRELNAHFALIDHATFEKEAMNAGLRIVQQWGGYSFEPFDPEISTFIIAQLQSQDQNE